MTNGEKLKEVFPYAQIDYHKATDLAVEHVTMVINDFLQYYPKWWWDSEYKEPTTKNNLGVDCISRAEAIKCLECEFDITGKENMKTVVNYINSAHDKIVNLPRVKQEPKTGHWVIKDNMWWVCSACGCQTRMMKKYNVPRFCPACGAKMEVV